MSKMKMHKIKGEKYGLDSNPVFPTITLTDKDLPAIKDWEVGKKYCLVFNVEQISIRQGSEWQGDTNKDDTLRVTFKLMEVGTKDDEEMEDADDDVVDYEAEYAEKRSGSNY